MSSETPMPVKKCIKCKKHKPIILFANTKKNMDGRDCYCMGCRKLQREGYRPRYKSRGVAGVFLTKTRRADG